MRWLLLTCFFLALLTNRGCLMTSEFLLIVLLFGAYTWFLSFWTIMTGPTCLFQSVTVQHYMPKKMPRKRNIIPKPDCNPIYIYITWIIWSFANNTFAIVSSMVGPMDSDDTSSPFRVQPRHQHPKPFGRSCHLGLPWWTNSHWSEIVLVWPMNNTEPRTNAHGRRNSHVHQHITYVAWLSPRAGEYHQRLRVNSKWNS